MSGSANLQKFTSPQHLYQSDFKSEDIDSAVDEMKERNSHYLNQLVITSRKVLLTTQSIFPFDLFPDQISIEPTQINFVKKSFFATYHMQSIPIKNVADVFLETSLLFASLKIIDSSYIENSVQVDYLKKDAACQARRIIQGLVVAIKNDITLPDLEPSELARKAEQLGEAQGIDLLLR